MKKKDWYSPGAVEARYSKPQIKWLMPHLSLLRSGVYPRSTRETGYTDPAISKAPIKAAASFEVSARIAAELDIRIQAAGVDGLMMEFLYAFEPDDEIFVTEHIAQCLNLGRQDVFHRIQNALGYVSGNSRKITSYKQYTRNLRR
ncbi:MAG: hypothetical protein E3J60_01220 [Dehalococcoidia bacterium]|nr:MAG: hypothetical protein E3J60_01220 [Dehalococcoidia bacterium]